MPINLYSNDGSQLIGSATFTNISLEVTSNTVSAYQVYQSASLYSGETILGVATSPNATTPTYPVSSKRYQLGSGTFNLYLVPDNSGVSVKYRGEEIAKMKYDGTKTLKTSGKYCEDDITIEYISGGGGSAPAIEVEALSVTENGTYTAPDGKAYSPVTVNVAGEASVPIEINAFATPVELVAAGVIIDISLLNSKSISVSAVLK